MQPIATHFMLIASLTCAIGAQVANADVKDRPFDFTDAHYRQNGIRPEMIMHRPSGTDRSSVYDPTAPSPIFRDVRIVMTTPAWDADGQPLFLAPLGEVTEDGFTDDRAGHAALEMAERSVLYMFPSASSSTFTKRQENLAPISGDNPALSPIGLWKVNYARYSERAFTTIVGRETLQKLGDRNGLDLDGTPIIRTLHELESLSNDGLVEISTTIADGARSTPWILCTVIKDPTDGGIAPDAYLAHLAVNDGSTSNSMAVFPRQFDCLQQSGDWCWCGGDINHNAMIDAADLAVLIDSWGECDGCDADFDQSGFVDLADLLMLISRWGACSQN